MRMCVLVGKSFQQFGNKYGRVHAVKRNKFSRFIKISVLNPSEFHISKCWHFWVASICGQLSLASWWMETLHRRPWWLPNFFNPTLTLARLFVGLGFGCGWKWHRHKSCDLSTCRLLIKIEDSLRESFTECVISTDPNFRLTNGSQKLEIGPIINVIIISIFPNRCRQHCEQFCRKWPLIGSTKIKENSFSLSLSECFTSRTPQKPDSKRNVTFCWKSFNNLLKLRVNVCMALHNWNSRKRNRDTVGGNKKTHCWNLKLNNVK